MFVSVIHRITDPDRFFAMANDAGQNLPPDLRLPQHISSTDRSTTICLWEAPSVERVREFLEPLTAGICKNEYAQVDAGLSAGLPTTTLA
ncbi:MAG TPA: hypothetical protein VKT72_05665 [Candidatus Baltobacteraceae bacterium]|nr:hypothetical protein [Candidatus Baltobacteraceae bacterium]